MWSNSTPVFPCYFFCRGKPTQSLDRPCCLPSVLNVFHILIYACVCLCLVYGVVVFIVTPSDPRVPLHPPCAAAALRQRVDGVDRRRGLRALIALRFVLVLLHRVLADERAVLIELAVAAFAVVHQAVVALLHVAVQRRLAALEGLVVLIAAAEAHGEQS